MKTKNVILGIAAFLFAIGSAFASRLIASPDWISVHYIGAPTFKCTFAPTCNNMGSLCKVNVVIAGGAIKIAQVYDLDTDKINCTAPLRDSRGIIGTISMPTVDAVRAQ